MRIVANIPHPAFTVTVFQHNEKYLVKLEGGLMEQTYKFPKEAVDSLETLKRLLDDAFYDRSTAIHSEMFINLRAALERK